LQIGLVLHQRLGEQRSLLRRHRLGLDAELPAIEPRQLDLELLEPGIAPSDLSALAFDLDGLVRDLDVPALDLACLLFDAQAHLRERGLHGPWQPLLVDVGHVAQTKHARHRAAHATRAP
jgi:hypothetical protein